MKKLVEAIRIFPKYYAASQRLGIELLISKQYIRSNEKRYENEN